MNYITKIDDRWYAFRGDMKSDQVYSIGADSPILNRDSNGHVKRGEWFARWRDAGIKAVASPSPSRSAAYQKARRNGEYGGEV